MGRETSAASRQARGKRVRSAIALFAASALGLAASAIAQSGAPTGQQTLRMTASTQTGGGGRSQGGSFMLQGTMGQTVARPMSGGAFLTQSGFLATCTVGCELGDIDCDGSVNGSDLGILLLLFGPCPDPYSCPGDLDNNGEVDAGDLGLMLVLWH